MGGGSVRLFEARLNAGETYTLVLSGRGTGYVEVMRATLGRSFESPIELDAEAPAYEKLLVRAGDAHWYAFTARQSGPATVYAEPAGYPAGSSPRLRGVLTDETGRVLAEARAIRAALRWTASLRPGRATACAFPPPKRTPVPIASASLWRGRRPRARIGRSVGAGPDLARRPDVHPSCAGFARGRARRRHLFHLQQRRGRGHAIGRSARPFPGHGRNHRARLGRGKRHMRSDGGGRSPLGHRLFAKRTDAAHGRKRFGGAGILSRRRFGPARALQRGRFQRRLRLGRGRRYRPVRRHGARHRHRPGRRPYRYSRSHGRPRGGETARAHRRPADVPRIGQQGARRFHQHRAKRRRHAGNAGAGRRELSDHGFARFLARGYLPGHPLRLCGGEGGRYFPVLHHLPRPLRARHELF